MFPWYCSLNNHVTCMTTEQLSIHLLVNSHFRTALLHEVFNNVKRRDIYHGMCDHCWVDDSITLKDVLDAFTYHWAHRDRKQTDLTHACKCLTEESECFKAFRLVECCSRDECLQRVISETDTSQQMCRCSLHVVVSSPMSLDVVKTQKILKHFTPSRGWYALMDCVLYDHQHWLDQHNTVDTSDSISMTPLSDIDGLSLEDGDKGNWINFLLTKFDELLGEVTRCGQHLKEGDDDDEDEKHYMEGNSVDDKVEDKSHNLSPPVNNNPCKYYYFVCSSQTICSDVYSLFVKRYTNNLGKSVSVRHVTGPHDPIGEIMETIALVVVMTTDIFIKYASGRHIFVIDCIVFCDILLSSYIEYVKLSATLMKMNPKKVLSFGCSDIETYKRHDDLLRSFVSIKYAGAVLCEDYWKLFRLCQSYGLDTCFEIDRTINENVKDEMIRLKSSIYMPLPSMIVHKIHGDEITSPMNTPNELVIEKADVSALRHVVKRLKEVGELKGDDVVVDDVRVQDNATVGTRNEDKEVSGVCIEGGTVASVSVPDEVAEDVRVQDDAIDDVCIKDDTAISVRVQDEGADDVCIIDKAVASVRVPDVTKGVCVQGDAVDDVSVKDEDEQKFIDITQQQESLVDKLSGIFVSSDDGLFVYQLDMIVMNRDRKGDRIDTACTPSNSQCSLGIATKTCFERIPAFTLYDCYGPIDVILNNSFSTFISKEDFVIVLQFQECVLEKICNIKLKSKAYIEERTNYRIVLLSEQNGQWTVDFSYMKSLINEFTTLFEQGSETIETADFDLSTQNEMLILPKHTLPSMRTIYRIISGSCWLPVTESFPDQSKALTYQDYYSKKYGLLIEDSETMVPLKGVKCVLNSINLIDYSVRKKSGSFCILIPQSLCCIYPLSFHLWRQLCSVPSILYKLKQLVTVGTLFTQVTGSEMPEMSETCTRYLKIALTSPSAVEDVDNEELEFYGDAVLKYAIITQLFLDNPDKNESYITFHKSNIVGNEQLYRIGMTRQLDRLVFCEKFNPKIVHSYLRIENHSYKGMNFAKEFSKTIANVVESLLGAFFLAGSHHWMTLLRWYGYKIDALERFLSNKVFTPQYSGLDQGVVFDDFLGNEANYNDLTLNISQLENTLNYKFKNTSLYLEACSHTNCPRRLNLWTHSSQRLECLGDAVLDMMVTTELIIRNKELERPYDHGMISEMRSFIVCNYVLAAVAVQLELHKHLRFSSSEQLRHILKWVTKVNELTELDELYPKRFYKAYAWCEREEYVEVPKDLNDCCEAVIGAVYLDVGGNLEDTWKYFKTFFQPVIDISIAHAPISLYYHLTSLSPNGEFESLPRRVNGDYCWRWVDGCGEVLRTGRTSRVAKDRVVTAAVFMQQNKIS